MVPVEELEGYSKRSRNLKLAALVIVLGALVVTVLLPARDQVAPSFDLPLLLGGGTLTSEELTGSPLVLNFFASWCAPCRDEAPLLERAYRRHRADGVRFVGVNLRDTSANAKRFVREAGLTFPVVVDEDQELASELGVYGLPQTFFIDEQGKLDATERGEKLGETAGTTTFGAISAEELERSIDALVEQAS